MSANPDSESQRRNAKRPLQKRVRNVAQFMPSPDMIDALELQERLGEDLVTALAKSAKSLPPGEQFEAAKGNELLSMQARHDLIIRLRAQGMHTSRISSALGVTRRTVENVVHNYFSHKEKELRNQRMDEFVLLMAEGYLEDIDRLTDIIQRSTHSAAVVGAIKARQEARVKYIDLLADFGFINRKPTEVHVSGDGTTIDARTQNVIVVDTDTLKRLTKQVLAEKRQVKGQPENDVEDERLADLVVYADDIV